jgi:hypothetical protein
VNVPYLTRPGGGFVLLVAVLLGAGSFLAWGFSTPPLESAWWLQVELELGERGPLTRAERDLFQGVLVRHPEIAESMLEGAPVGLISAAEEGRVEVGYAYLVRQKAEPPIELVVSRSPAVSAAEPVAVSARVHGASQAGEIAAGSPFRWVVPQDGPFPQLIEVRVEAPRKRREVMVEARPIR